MNSRMILDPVTGALRPLRNGEVVVPGGIVRTPMTLMDNAPPVARPMGAIQAMQSVKDLARPVLGDAAMEGLADHEIRRKAVARWLGEEKVARQSDSYVDAAFNYLANADMRLLPPAAKSEAQTPAAKSEVQTPADKARDLYIEELQKRYLGS